MTVISAPDVEAQPTRLAYRPALDGLRGLAVAAVLAFHLGYPWAKGGYLGVSIFFTLSGFLITTLLLEERATSGRTDLKRFWSRRARRLLPPALLGLVLAAAVTASMPQAPVGAAGDLFGALADVANWRFLLAGRSYGDLFASPSAALHYWSLSIEEQFYAIYPVVVFLALRRSTPRRLFRWCAIGLTVSWLVLVACRLANQHDFAYFSTVTRAGELLIGAMAAIAIRSRVVESERPASHGREVGEVLALVALGVACTSIPQSSRMLELGGLPSIALLSSVVVTAAFRGGLLAGMLSWRPLVAVGRISYGLYVYHWPVILWLTSERTGLDGLALNGLRVAVSASLAVVSYQFVEQPIRAGRWPSSRLARRVVPVAYAAVAVVVLVVGATVTPAIDFGKAEAALRDAQQAAPGSVAAGTPRIGVFGDSTGLMVALGLSQWGRVNGQLRVVGGDSPLGCSIARGGQRRYRGHVDSTTPECDGWTERWVDKLAANPVDVAVVAEGVWEVVDRKLAGDDSWRHIGDPTFDRHLHDELITAVDLLLRHADTVVLLTAPDVRPDLAASFPETDPARMRQFNDVLRQVASERPRTAVVDLNAHLRTLPGGEMDRDYRPDGIHFTALSGLVVAGWLGPQILAAHRRA